MFPSAVNQRKHEQWFLSTHLTPTVSSSPPFPVSNSLGSSILVTYLSFISHTSFFLPIPICHMPFRATTSLPAPFTATFPPPLFPLSLVTPANHHATSPSGPWWCRVDLPLPVQLSRTGFHDLRYSLEEFQITPASFDTRTRTRRLLTRPKFANVSGHCDNRTPFPFNKGSRFPLFMVHFPSEAPRLALT